MIISVSILIRFIGAATPVMVVNFFMDQTTGGVVGAGGTISTTSAAGAWTLRSTVRESLISNRIRISSQATRISTGPTNRVKTAPQKSWPPKKASSVLASSRTQ